MELAGLGVLEAAAALRSRAISAVELLAACEKAIEQRNGGKPSFEGSPGAVNAWVRLYPEIAAEQARAADERIARERDSAPLLARSGLPVGVSLIAPRGREAELLALAIDLQEHELRPLSVAAATC
jgi:aspartyl-tRNA(Asn)/glutamyl-tRNA(Gln) amidotransferase subunit A